MKGWSLNPLNHQCARLKFDDFWKSSPKFFPRGWGEGRSSNFLGPNVPKSGLPRALGARFTKNYENLEDFEKFRLNNAIKKNFRDLLNKIFLNFLYKNDLFDCKTLFLAVRKL